MRKAKSSSFGARYLAIGVVFCVICLAFIVVLGIIQLKGTHLPAREEGYTRTYTVPGVRGEIYDRNGKKIVGNSTSYDLIYEYGAMPDTRREVNMSLLAIMAALEDTGNGDKISDDLFVLEGTYPKMRFSAAVRDRESDEYYHYTKFLERRGFERAETDADDVVDYFVRRYSLSDSIYTDEEISTLIRLYYEMERVDFGYYESYTIASDVSMELITRIEEANIEGVNFSLRAEREYLYPGIASHILGRLGRITAETAEHYLALGYPIDALVGTSGCEAAFEEYLRGENGKMCLKYDDDGNLLEKYYEVEPKSGNDVYLTIDIDLQVAAEEALASNVGMVESADAGAVTAIDANSGDVLVIASYPTYDLTRFSSQEYYDSLIANEDLPLYNRALQGVYAPGSTYKIGAALAALESGEIDDKITYSCNMYHYFMGKEFSCLGSHGEVNVVDAIRESCNVFFYHLGETMGADRMTAYTERLGLGADTGIELGDKNGIVAGPAYRDEMGLGTWMPGDDLSAAIGQSDHGYTPLQLSVYMSTVVNGGTRYSAHLLESVRTFYSGDVVLQKDAEVLDTVEFSDETYKLLIESMRQVVSSSGTLNTYFADVPVTVGGKTGTAQVTGKRDYALFCGFAPLDTPELVISCVIEEGAVGARAAYTVGKIMEKYFEGRAAGFDAE